MKGHTQEKNLTSVTSVTSISVLQGPEMRMSGCTQEKNVTNAPFVKNISRVQVTGIAMKKQYTCKKSLINVNIVRKLLHMLGTSESMK